MKNKISKELFKIAKELSLKKANIDFIKCLNEHNIINVNEKGLIKFFEFYGIHIDRNDIEISDDVTELSFSFTGYALDGSVEPSSMVTLKNELKKNQYVDFIHFDTNKYFARIDFKSEIELD